MTHQYAVNLTIRFAKFDPDLFDVAPRDLQEDNDHVPMHAAGRQLLKELGEQATRLAGALPGEAVTIQAFNEEKGYVTLRFVHETPLHGPAAGLRAAETQPFQHNQEQSKMTTSGNPLHVALANHMSEPGYLTARRMPESRVHLNQEAVNNGLDARMMLAYTAGAVPDPDDPRIQPGSEFGCEYYPMDDSTPRVFCHVLPVWTLGAGQDEPPKLLALRATVSVGEDVVGAAYVELGEAQEEP